MPIFAKIRVLIQFAWADGSPCLLATFGPNGPNISPKDSTIVYGTVRTTRVLVRFMENAQCAKTTC